MIKKIARSISIILPAYNEEGNIKKSVLSAISMAKCYFYNFEIIVVNDGSTDETADILNRLSKKYKNIKIIHQPNKGYGGAVWAGIEMAKNTLIFYTDSDLQFDITEIIKFIPYIINGKYEAVFGYRLHRKDSPIRIFNAFGWKILNRVFYGIKIKDIDCAFKLFKRSIFTKIGKIQSRGATFSSELILRMQAQKIKIKELPVNHYPRKNGRATGARLDVILRAFKELWYLRYWKLCHPTKINKSRNKNHLDG